MRRLKSLLASLFIFVIPFPVFSQVPHTFTDGTPALAEEVNANFGALVSALDALTARVNALESTTTASLAGTYDYFEIGVDVDQNSSSGFSIAGSGTTGTVVLNANGTGTISLNSQYRQLTFNEQNVQIENVNVLSTDVAHFNTPETINNSITWSHSAGVLTIATGDGDANFVVAGRILVESIASEGQNGVTLMVRR